MDEEQDLEPPACIDNHPLIRLTVEKSNCKEKDRQISQYINAGEHVKNCIMKHWSDNS